MPMSASVLKAELEKMIPTDVEADAAAALAAAYAKYATDAIGSGVAILPAGPTAGRAAMEPLLTGMSADGAGAAIIAAAIVQFWVTAAPVGWPAPMVAVPPPNAGLAVALPLKFLSNTVGELAIGPAMLEVATVLHAQAIIGGTVAIPPAGPLPVT